MKMYHRRPSRRNGGALPLFEWAELHHPSVPLTQAGSRIATRWRVSPSLANRMAELAFGTEAQR